MKLLLRQTRNARNSSRSKFRLGFVALLALASAASAQQPSLAASRILGEIRGVVVEPGPAATPVAEAEVTLDYYGLQQPRLMPAPVQKSFTASTSPTGSFVFRVEEPGFFGVRCVKVGYRAAGTSPAAPSNANITLTVSVPSRDVKLFLARPAVVTGTIVDAGSGEPLPEVKIAGGPVMYMNGRRIFMGAFAASGPDGRFKLTSSPGDYAIQVNPQAANKDRVLRSFGEKDFEKVDVDYEHTFWPGGLGEDAAMPIPVASGGVLDLGRIRVRRVPYYRVRLRIPKETCRPDELIALNETTRGPQFDTRTTTLASDIPCGSDLLILGFKPGTYRLSLSTRPAPRSIASVPITIVDRNVEGVASLSRGFSVDGRIVLDEGAAKVDFAAIDIRIDPVWTMRTDPNGATPGDTGEFRIDNLVESEHRVMIAGVPPTHYVKDVKFNGALLPHRIFSLDAAGMARSVAITLDDKPAALSGTIKEGDRPVSGAVVLLAMWPLPGNQVFMPAARTTADEQGRFHMGGLAPGDYRVVAVRTASEEHERLPHALERALAGASRIELVRRESRSITLEPVTLR
jgi:hypothetical protein